MIVGLVLAALVRAARATPFSYSRKGRLSAESSLARTRWKVFTVSVCSLQSVALVTTSELKYRHPGQCTIDHVYFEVSITAGRGI